MGIVRFGAPFDLILLLKEEFSIKEFVETGAFHGTTTAWAAQQFDTVYAVELDKDVYRNTARRLSQYENVRFLQGDSSVNLEKIMSRLRGPAVFWLDAHWMGDQLTRGVECPLIDEIRQIHASPYAQYILIDDARLFLSPPPTPCDRRLWPTLDDVVSALQAGGHRYYVVLFDDVIFAVPSKARRFLGDWMQSENTSRWRRHLADIARTNWTRGLHQISSGLMIKHVIWRVKCLMPRWLKRSLEKASRAVSAAFGRSSPTGKGQSEWRS
jgi:hypothetical protein